MATPNTAIVRRRNLNLLYQEYVAAQLSAGEGAKGVDASFAESLGVSPGRWSQMKSASYVISDKIARQIEGRMRKESGWIDVPRGAVGPDAGEEKFVEAARDAWRTANAKGKRELMGFVKARRAN